MINPAVEYIQHEGIKNYIVLQARLVSYSCVAVKARLSMDILRVAFDVL